MLTIIHDNPVWIEGDQVAVDRKFLDGMARFSELVEVPITSTHPLRADRSVIDSVEVQLNDLPFRLVGLPTDRRGVYTPEALSGLERIVSSSVLVAGSCMGGGLRLARRHGRPYIMTVEYDLGTQCTVASIGVGSRTRGWIRRVRAILDYCLRQVPDMRAAAEVHCNGFPMFDAARRWNERCLLYLDSRMGESMVIGDEALACRLAEIGKRRPRLIYSGRYEAMKGALDFVKTAIDCRRLGMDADFICHGQGRQVVAMREAVAAAGMGDRVLVGDSLPYPELVKLTKSCDAFVACHVQADPSCSYLEAMGCGLPVFGYANRMARRICGEAHCGAVSPIGAHGLLARQIVEAFAVPERLASWARTARKYALDHCFEKEFAKRAAAVRRQYDLAL